MDPLRTRIPARVSSYATVAGVAGPSLHSPAGECPAGPVPPLTQLVTIRGTC